MVYCACVEDLLSNSREDFISSSEILIKLANNILNNPENQKYRQIRISNPMIENRLLAVSGAMECLFEMGFQEAQDGRYLQFPRGALFDNMKRIRDDLNSSRNDLLSNQTTTSSNAAAAAAASVPDAAGATASDGNSVTVNHSIVKEMIFYQKLNNSFEHVLIYEDKSLQAKARRCMPTEQFTRDATEKLKALKQATNKDETNADDLPGFKELVLLELLNWFKTSFFTWVNSPECSRCNGQTEARGMTDPTDEDRLWGASRVENYFCSNCREYERFARYNHPGRLLETRRGRCGEWANCFTLCCRALNLEARYVLDWTDHVWTEVYSESFGRWLHCDPCENTCDKPLTYEVGWGKKLTYVIAFSNEDIQDVTPRYTVDQTAVLSRRDDCREDWLIDTIFKLRSKRQKDLPEQRKKELEMRSLRELIEFLSPKEVKEGEKSGRQSGSLEWRLSRDEMGSSSKFEKFTFSLTDNEKSAKSFHITYNCAKDVYTRLSDNGNTIMPWKSCAFEVENVIRKVENDWKMVYLARKEGSNTATISWKFDFSGSGLRADQIKIKVSSTTYESGKVTWVLCGGDSCIAVKPDEEVVTSNLKGSETLTLTARLSGGNGNNAFQHTQLFRQQENSDDCPLDLQITFI
ncbi:peptide-N(4)-(N-acetyl-beta-glucosaminyl)asparagine amidase-like [Tubulanus polymorphus]|uniref:peptide-N(4)-(N-acetyl-beta- glucosaminyl)asparagine amidase-like n=1 Tax=Tubulanus polymorphus TaxID=672921 RepID=UPI003DA4B65B